MSFLLPTLAVAFAAFCVWLTVRIVNRRERPGWRFWVLVTSAVLVAYPLSWGPVVWMRTRNPTPRWADQAIVLPYLPLIALTKKVPALDVACRRYSARWYPRNYPPCFLPYVEPTESTAELTQSANERKKSKPLTFRVVGIMSDGERGVLATELTLDTAEFTAEYIVQNKLMDEAFVEPE